jgi:hypothetical protein
MRLRLLDRIRRLIRRQPAPEAVSAQGKHRRGKRRGSAPPTGSTGPPGGSGDPSAGQSPGPGEWPGPPGEPPSSAGWPASTPPDGSPVATAWPVPGSPAPGLTPAAHGDGIGTVPDSRGPGSPAVRTGSARARIREAPQDEAAAGFAEVARSAPAAPSPRPHSDEAARPGPAHAAGAAPGQRADTRADTRTADLARVAAGVPRQPGGGGRSSLRAAGAALRTRLPFTAPQARERPPAADGRRNCGSIERVLWRQWDTATPPPAEVIAAVDRLAELPERIKERLADGLDAIFIGPGGVPELDEMTSLRGVPLPAGRATWDACAGAYGERKIVVGSQPSPTPDVMCHEVGHALDDLDSPPGKWQSDSAEFRMLYDQCQPHLASDFHQQPGGLGRKEFFADAFAAIASRQRPALVDMLSGDTRTALRVMLYFNRRYGI